MKSNSALAGGAARDAPLEEKQQMIIIKPTRKRYFILLMYAICSMQKSFQWINLSTITNKVAFYYQVDNIAVNWTSVLFMITFIPLVLPTGWLIERIGLRKAVLIGASGIALGAIVKCFATSPTRFYVIILGQIIVSLSEQFIFCIPARIASVWFPDNQVSLATGFGIFGNQCGIALGFLIPQALLDQLETQEEIAIGLWRLFLWTAILATATLFVLALLFDDAPKHAPGAARANKLEQEAQLARLRPANSAAAAPVCGAAANEFWQHLKKLLIEPNCDLLVLAYGLNVGTGYAIQTVLNQLVVAGVAAGAGSEKGWPEDANELVGVAGLLIIFCGMCGALFWGHLCDRSRRYILITRLLYVGTIISLLLFGLSLHLLAERLLLYFASGFMGFMLIGYTVAGLDTVVELTYPAPELISTSLMNLAPSLFGSPITLLCSLIVDTYNSDAAIGFLLALLCVGLAISLAIREQLRRQIAVDATKIAGQPPPTQTQHKQDEPDTRNCCRSSSACDC